jgi:hypothetical protein
MRINNIVSPTTTYLFGGVQKMRVRAQTKEGNLPMMAMETLFMVHPNGDLLQNTPMEEILI